MTNGWLEEDPGPPVQQDLRSEFDVLPLKRALEYVVSEARKQLAAGNDDHFVAVGRIAQAALTWQRLDELGQYEEAEKWLLRIPR
jgi:hypothetical protein